MSKISLLIIVVASQSFLYSQSSNSDSGTWVADNGNGTFTNPLFYEEFSDPDLIRVGDDYYMTGTTMHTVPGLPVLHSKDLVNWELLSYAVERLDLGPEFSLEDNKNVYGRGIWAPCIRYHDGTFYIFTNINSKGTQVYSAKDPAGPWKHHTMNVSLHDLSVLFDDDGKIYAVWDYNELKMAQLTPDLRDIIPGTERVVVEANRGAGEGCHFYKINGKYYITNTNYDPVCYQLCLRADKPYGPYEMKVMSAEENLGIGTGYRLWNTTDGPPFDFSEPVPNNVGCIPMHQGGIVETQFGEWWGWSMLDHNSVGRVTALSPVTWQEGWPHFGLPGNLNRSPRTWIKPNTGFTSEPRPLFKRDDDFDAKKLNPIWQWNHNPVNEKWSLSDRDGYLRLHSMPATSFWQAKNSLTQRGVGPESIATVKLELPGLKIGDRAGLALLNLPYAWIGVAKEEEGTFIRFNDQQKQQHIDQPLNKEQIWLRAYCNFDTDKAQLSYSLDGKKFVEIGNEVIMPYQLKTFQGVRYALFNFNTKGREGGYADFDNFKVEEPRRNHLKNEIPYNKVIKLTSLADGTVLTNWRNLLRPVPEESRFAQDSLPYFRVLDRGQGRVALQSVSDGGFVTVTGEAGMAEVRILPEEQLENSQFQWQDMLRDDLMLLSLYSHKYIFVDPNAGSPTAADAPGARPDRKGGACFSWEIVEN